MKHFNFKPDAQLVKLSLVGTLLAALGTSVSFNPQTLTIARNEVMVTGSTSLASKSAPEKSKASGGKGARQEAAKPADKKEAVSDSKKEESGSEEVSLTLDNGVKVHGVWEKKAEKVVYEFQCDECDKSKLRVESLDASNLSNLKTITMVLRSDAQAKWADKIEAAKTSDTRSAKKEEDKKKKDPVEDVNEKLATSECDELETDNSNMGDILVCQKDELSEILKDCKEKEREQDRSSTKISSKEKVSCTKIVKNYFEKYVKSVMQAGLSADPETSRAAHSLGQSAVTMMLGNRMIPSRFITPELSKEIDALVRQSDLALAQQRYNRVYNNWNNSITICQLQSSSLNMPSNNCGSQNDATRNASLAASAYLTNLQMGGPFSDGTILSLAASGLANANQNQDFMAQYQSEYAIPLQSLRSIFASGNGVAANSMIQQYLAGTDPSAITIGANGLPVVSQNGQQVIGQQQGLGQQQLGSRNGRNDLQLAPVAIPGRQMMPTQPGMPQQGFQTMPGVQPTPGFQPTPQQGVIPGTRSAFN